MNTKNLWGGAAAIGAVAVVTAIALSRTPATTGSQSPTPAPAAAKPAPRAQTFELLHAQRFQVEQPFRHVWRRDPTLVQSGWLLVLGCEPSLLQPRQVEEPVLYVGAETANRVNLGSESGRVVVLVPGDFALEEVPMWFGKPALPEALTQARIDQALAEAVADGVVPQPTEVIQAAFVAEPLHVAGEYELRLAAIDLVEEHSPQEIDLIRGVRAPRVR